MISAQIHTQNKSCQATWVGVDIVIVEGIVGHGNRTVAIPHPV